ncbi:MAG: urea transporter [Cyclobacteriaceae bacterium]
MAWIVKRPFFFLKVLLRGIGQIMLQENAITGLLFLIGLFYASVLMGIAALLATLMGTATAYVFGFDKKETGQGLYGFSAALVGVATFVFLKPVLISWLILAIGSVTSAVIQHFFIKRAIPVFTLPFVLVTWGIVYGITYLTPDLLLETGALPSASSDMYFFPLKGYGQVIFQASLWSGILFFVGVIISSRISAVYGLLGAIVSGVTALPFVPFEEIANGLLSYNAVLCALVFAGKEIKDAVWALVAVVLSLVFSLLLKEYQLLALTFPFVLASYLTLLIKGKLAFVFMQCGE